MKKIIITVIVAITPLSAFSEGVVENYTSGFYLGAGLGSVDFDDDSLSDDLGYDVGYPGAIKTESDDTSLKIIAGYQINRIVGVEGSYTDYGDTDYTIFGQDFMTFDIQAISLAANLGFSFDSGWRPFALIGLSYVMLDLDSPLDSSLSASENYLGVHYGIGVEYSPSAIRNLAFRVALEGDIFVDDSFDDSYNYYYEEEYAFNVSAFYAGLTYRF